MIYPGGWHGYSVTVLNTIEPVVGRYILVSINDTLFINQFVT